MSEATLRMTDEISPGVTVVTTLHPEGDRWIASVYGGPHDGYSSVMDAGGDPATLHASVIADLNAGALDAV